MSGIQTDQSLGLTARLSLRAPVNTPLVDKNGLPSQQWFHFFALIQQFAAKVLLQPMAFAQLPTPTKAPITVGGIHVDIQPNQGTIALVTDSTVNSFGAIISAGGGSDIVLAFCDGTNWRVACGAGTSGGGGGGSLPLTPTTVSALGAPASNEGNLALVTDSPSPVYGTILTTGGGTNIVLAYCTGVSWLVCGGVATTPFYLQMVASTYSGLPASPTEGDIAALTDATTNTWGASVTVGGGSHKVLIWYNGTNWTCIGV